MDLKPLQIFVYHWRNLIHNLHNQFAITDFPTRVNFYRFLETGGPGMMYDSQVAKWGNCAAEKWFTLKMYKMCQ